MGYDISFVGCDTCWQWGKFKYIVVCKRFQRFHGKDIAGNRSNGSIEPGETDQPGQHWLTCFIFFKNVNIFKAANGVIVIRFNKDDIDLVSFGDIPNGETHRPLRGAEK